MSAPDSKLDQHLQSLFGDLDARAYFDARLMARLKSESQLDVTERAMWARQQERARYQRAISELQSWRRSTLRLLALDTFGIAALLVVAIGAAWPLFGADAAAMTRQYGPDVLMLLSILIAAVPLVITWAEQSHPPVRQP